MPVVPVLLFLLSLAVVGFALTSPGMSDLLLLAGPAALASLLILLRDLLRRALRRVRARSWVVVDGSNVMHWKDGEPRIATVREVIGRLSSMGFTPGVVFDANAGYKLAGRYQHDRALGRLLGLPEDHVMVVPKGEPADPVLLAAARDLGARVVSMDRFRDWEEMFPEIRKRGYLIRGGYRDGALWLDLD